MNSSEAYRVASEPQPTPEETVDLCCPNCAGFWASRSSCVHTLGDKDETVYKHFLGRDNVDIDPKTSKFVYLCPNGCTDSYTECRTKLNDVHSVGIMTPLQRWEYANALVEHDRLSNRLDELEKEIRQHEAYL